MKIKTIMLSCFFVLLFAGTASGQGYYISPQGNDNHSGAFSQPWRTLTKANQTLQPGDTLYMRTGTWFEDINPVRSGIDGRPIVYTRYADEQPVIRGFGNGDDAAVAIGYPGGSSGWRDTGNIVIDGLTVRPVNASYGIALYGNTSRNIVIRNCQIINEALSDPRDHGILISGTQNTLIENNIIEGEWDLGIITTGGPEGVIIRNNTIREPYGSCIDIQTSYGENQAMLIENNLLAGSRVEDGIQFEPDYTGFDPGTWRGVVIRKNTICNHAENAIDLKGAAHVVIEGNRIYGNRGDNDGSGNMGGGAGGIMKGDIARTQAHHIIIRKNLIWDNLGGVYMTNHTWMVYNNTILGNNRTYLGADISAQAVEGASGDQLRRRPGLSGVMLIETEVSNFNGSMVKNNIIGGHHQGEIAIRTTADLGQTEIDGNCYYNLDILQFSQFQANWNWSKVGLEGIRDAYAGIPGPAGEDALSFTVSHPGFGYAGDAPVGEGPFDFRPASNAPVIDAGVFLTTATESGSGITLPVANAAAFYAGYGIVEGDSIQVSSSGERAVIIDVDYENHILTLNRPLSFQQGDGISLAFCGSAPDIGAFEHHSGDSLCARCDASIEFGQAPLEITFTTAVIGGSPPYAFCWTFGDGGTSSEAAPVHMYSNGGIYTARVEVSDAGSFSASDSVRILVVTGGGQPEIVDFRISHTGRQDTVLSLKPSAWYDLTLTLANPGGWSDMAFADIWLSGEGADQGTIENRGGPFDPANKYVFSYSIAEHSLWAKQMPFMDTWSLISGQLGLYLDDDNGEYLQDSTAFTATARFMLLEEAQSGEWKVEGYLRTAGGKYSSLRNKAFTVRHPFNTVPYASISFGMDSQKAHDLIHITVNTSHDVSRIPVPLIMTQSDQTSREIELQGDLPGKRFTGILRLDDTVPEGNVFFSFGSGALQDADGNSGNMIQNGAAYYIERGPPLRPVKVTITGQ